MPRRLEPAVDCAGTAAVGARRSLLAVLVMALHLRHHPEPQPAVVPEAVDAGARGQEPRRRGGVVVGDHPRLLGAGSRDLEDTVLDRANRPSAAALADLFGVDVEGSRQREAVDDRAAL